MPARDVVHFPIFHCLRPACVGLAICGCRGREGGQETSLPSFSFCVRCVSVCVGVEWEGVLGEALWLPSIFSLLCLLHVGAGGRRKG